jgi:hypothetical protein
MELDTAQLVKALIAGLCGKLDPVTATIQQLEDKLLSDVATSDDAVTILIGWLNPVLSVIGLKSGSTAALLKMIVGSVKVPSVDDLRKDGKRQIKMEQKAGRRGSNAKPRDLREMSPAKGGIGERVPAR